MPILRFSCGALFLTAFLASPADGRAQTPSSLDTSVLRGDLEQLAGSFSGKVGVFARNLDTGEEVGVNADEHFPMASTYKVAIMVHVFREVEAGHLALEERIPIKESDRRLGSGLLMFMTPGLSPTLHDLLLTMITLSDNEATDLLLKRVGPANVTATLRKLGIQDFRVDRSTEEIIGDWLAGADPSNHRVTASEVLANPVAFSKLTPEQIERADRTFVNDPRDHASPRAMTDLVTKISRSEAASKKSCEDMLDIMQQQQLRGRIHRFLENVTIASKNGTIGYVTNETGIIYAGKQHIALTVFTLKANNKVTTEEAEERIGRIARRIYDYFHDTHPSGQ